MSADNYLSVKRNGDKWAVFNGCASNGRENIRKDAEYETRDEAIDAANRILSGEMIEYGLSYIEPIKATEV